MLKQRTINFLILSAFLLLPTSISAQTPTTVPSNTRREQVQQNVQERQELRQENQAERQQLREQNQQERQENRQERRDQRTQNHANRLQNRFRVYSQRLSDLITKLDNRLNQLSQEGKDIAAARTQLEKAKASLTEATRLGEQAIAAFSAIEAESYEAQRSKALAARDLAEQARAQFKATADALKEAVRLAKAL